MIRGDGVCWIGRVDVSTLAESSGEPKAGDDRGDRLFGAGRSIRGSCLYGTGERGECSGTLCRNL